MSRTLSTIAALALSAIALYAASKSYVAITNLRRYEERSEKAARHSETAARELHQTRVTQASSAGAIAFSLISSLSLAYGTLTTSDSDSASAWTGQGVLVPVLNIAVIAAAGIHNRGYWKAKPKVPFVGGINDGIEASKEIRQAFVVLGVAWGVFGVVRLVRG